MSNKRLEFTNFGNPLEVLSYVEGNVNELDTDLKDGEYILRNLASPIHPSNVLLITGSYPPVGITYPAVPGNDTIAYVYKAGPNTKYAEGTRVIPIIRYGAFGEYVKVHEKFILIDVPDSVDNYNGSQFIVNGLTSYILIDKLHKFKEGEWALQTAAGSTVGRAIIQIAKLRGINLINVVRREAQIEELKALGAEHVIVYNGENDKEVEEQVQTITGGKGIKVAFDPVGGSTGSLAVRTLSVLGRYIAYGLLSGKPIEFNGGSAGFKKVTAEGFYLLNWFEDSTREEIQKTSQELIDLLGSKKLTLRYDEVYELKDYKIAFERNLKDGKKVILVPSKE